MPPSPKKRLHYGSAKYAAFHLLLSRWLRHHPQGQPFRYVTLGGTELRDAQSLYYIDNSCMSNTISYELKRSEYNLALATRDRLRPLGLQVDVRRGDIFSFERLTDEPHVFFIDLKGCCVLSDYDEKFAALLFNNHLRSGDSLLITSHLGARRGWANLLAEFKNEFATLAVSEDREQKRCFRRSHTAFTLFRALQRIGYEHDVTLRCFGCIEYRDKSPMSIVGYTVSEGVTSFRDLVHTTPYFQIKQGLTSL